MMNPIENLKTNRPQASKLQIVGGIVLIGLVIVLIPVLVGILAKLVYYGFNLI